MAKINSVVDAAQLKKALNALPRDPGAEGADFKALHGTKKGEKEPSGGLFVGTQMMAAFIKDKKELGTAKVFEGTVKRSAKQPDKRLVLVCANASNTLKEVARACFKQGGLPYQVVVLKPEEPEPDEVPEEVGESGETDVEETGQGAPPKTGPDPAATRFATRLKALAPLMQKVEAMGGAHAQAVKLLSAQGTKAFTAKQYDAANAALDKLETIIKQALGSGGGGGTTTPPQDGAARFATRLKALAPAVQKVGASGSPQTQAIKQQIAEANKLYVAKQYDDANTALDQVEKLLKQALAGGGQGAEIPAALVKQFLAAADAWQDASDTVDKQISQLQAALRRENDEDFTEIADKGMNGITGNHKVRLMAILREGRSAQGPDLKKLAGKGFALATAFKEHLDDDIRVEACDENPFGVAVAIRPTLGKALDQLAAACQAVSKA